MVDLPPVPKLDPDDSSQPSASDASAVGLPAVQPAPTAATKPAASQPVPQPAPTAATKPAASQPVPQPAPTAATKPAASQPVPQPAPATDARAATQPMAQMSPAVTRQASQSDNGENAVQDSVEEVLQQTSAQTLQLSHLEDILHALNQTLTDLQDEMHAGFAEVRAVAESTADQSGSRSTDASAKDALSERLDFVEDQALQANKRQSLLTIIAIAQAILLVAVLIAVIATSGTKPATDLPVPGAYTTSEQPEPLTPSELRKTSEDTRKAKKRRRRR